MSTAPTSYETLSIERREGVDWVTLNRPEQFNALNGLMTDELLDYFGGLYFDHGVRVVMLRGAGKHFCAGLDLQETAAFTRGVVAGARGQRRVAEIILRMRRCPQPGSRRMSALCSWVAPDADLPPRIAGLAGVSGAAQVQ